MVVIPVRVWILYEKKYKKKKKKRKGKTHNEIKKSAGDQSTETPLTDCTRVW